MVPSTWARQHPFQSLLYTFAASKLLLLLVALCSPGPGYDTSTSLVFAPQPALGGHPVAKHGGVGPLPTILHAIAIKLTRWDAIYFTQAAARGYRFEQEWAFGWGFNRIIALITSLAINAGIPYYHGLESLVAILIAHTAHLFSALTLFYLTVAVFPSSASSGFALTSSILHILSPAGLFLSAPFAESSCALLSLVGYLLFTKSRPLSGMPTVSHDLLVLVAGIVFGAAATLRSNAILNGLLLLEEAVRTLYGLRFGLYLNQVRRLMVAGLGGLCVGVGFLLPQYLAYIEFCTSPDVQLRPWCDRALPSIYTFVQDHYWNVGLFRYFTLSNMPLFLLAAPMLIIMVVSGTWALGSKIHTPYHAKTEKYLSSLQDIRAGSMSILRNLAISQLLLALLIFTTAHVQIISRISSACPVWVWYLSRPSGEGAPSSLAKTAVIFMIMYGLIQGVLFSSFLPPA